MGKACSRTRKGTWQSPSRCRTHVRSHSSKARCSTTRSTFCKRSVRCRQAAGLNSLLSKKYGYAVDPEGLHLRSHRGRGVGEEIRSRRLQSMRFLRSCRPGSMPLRSCKRHSKRSRRDGGSRASFMSRVRSRRRRGQRGRKGVSQ